MKLQSKLENGKWTDESRVEKFVDMAVERDTFFAMRENRAQMDRQGVLDALSAGKVLPYDTDWYAQIRDADAIQSKPVATQRPQTLCDCGHYAAHPMTTAQGTACPNCYDRMSN